MMSGARNGVLRVLSIVLLLLSVVIVFCFSTALKRSRFFFLIIKKCYGCMDLWFGVRIFVRRMFCSCLFVGAGLVKREALRRLINSSSVFI